MKKLFGTTALVMALAMPAFAQEATTDTTTDTTTTMPADTTAGMSSDAAGSQYLPGVQNGVRASDFLGKRIYVTEQDTSTMAVEALAEADAQWENAGEISDMIITLEGDTDAVLVDFGGFLGIGAKTVAISMADLVMVPDSSSPDDYFIVFQGSRASLEGAPEFDEDMVFEAEPVDAAMTDGAVPADGMAANDQALTAPADGTMATDGSMAADGTMATDGAVAADGTMAAEGTTAADGTMATDGATDGTVAADGTAAVDGTMPADGAVTADGSAAAITDDGEMVDLATMTEADLMGMRVVGIDNEDVGEISAVAVGADGAIEGAVVDVGGFLGIGEKRVSLGSDALTMVRNAGGTLDHFRVSMTQEQLEALPTYEG